MMDMPEYDNRELSWLKFNERILEEAADESVPLGERLLFASIYQTNLDEFFMIRVGTLYDRLLVNENDRDNKTGLTPKMQISAIQERVKKLSEQRDETYSGIMKDLLPLDVEQIKISSLTAEEEAYLRAYFGSEIKPLISPQVVDKRHPFPFLSNKTTYIVAHLETKNSVKLGLLPVTGNGFPRMIVLPDKKKLRFILAEDVMLHYCSSIFDNYRISGKAIIRLTRNADIDMEEGLYDHEVDLRDIMEQLLKKRKKLAPVRLEMNGELGTDAMKRLLKHLDMTEDQISRLSSPLDMSFVFSLRNRIEKAHPELFFEPFYPQRSAYIAQNSPIIPQILRRDLKLSYPYESIRPFISLLNEAGNDPDVVSIKITLYRVASNSKIIEALINAAENGKEVFVLVELRARFDEENNIGWSRQLERAGCKVMYGPEHIKVHSKLLLITRKNGSTLQYITQIGTGNYNEKTSELYTDLSLMTADMDIGKEAGEVFHALSIGNLVENTSHLMVAPLALQNKVCELIDYEIAAVRSGKEGYLGFKLNSLTDKVLIDKLIEASCEGVKIEMVIRGICCLIPGIPGKTENITVRSIVGRYLEHSRIYIFGKDTRRKVYISSADFMTRNTVRRVEVAAPIRSADIEKRILDIFDILMHDNVKARIAQPDGTYKKVTRGEDEAPLMAQAYFEEQAQTAALEAAQRKPVRVKVARVRKK
ncbi:MAG: polyphosphate kinase 1 [Oscillospiraceae bacterium]|nr:polyphosphate kinase 1 [Oscillospiraceae bacterium]